MGFRLILLFAILRKPNIISRSLRYLPLILTFCLFFALVWRSQSQLIKWWMSGIARPRWTRQPMFVLRIFLVDVPSSNNFWLHLSRQQIFVRESDQESTEVNFHPRIFLISWRRASNSSLFIASIVLWGIGSSGSSGHKTVPIPRSGARSHLIRLSISLTSTVRETRLSIYMSVVPRGSTRMLTINSKPLVKGTKLSKNSGGGARCWFLP